MAEYMIKPDMKNFDDPLFVWYLIFANMSQNFSAILDVMLPYLNKPGVLNAPKTSLSREEHRIYNFILRVAFGYVSEAQKTIREFINSPDHDFMESVIPKEHLDIFVELRQTWKKNNSNYEYKYLSELRNSVFHFAPNSAYKEEYKERFQTFVTASALLPSLKLSLSNYEIKGHEYRQDTFCDILWILNISKGYNKISNCIEPGSEDYAKDVVDRLLHSIDLCYHHIFVIRDFLEQYFIHNGIIIEETPAHS